MALAVTCTVTFVDSKGKTANTKVRVPSGFSVAQYIEFAQGAAQIFTNVSLAKVTSVSFAIGVDLSGATIRSAALTAADIAQKMLMIARSAVSGLFARFNVPTANEAKVISGTDQFDSADTDVAALVAAIETGLVISGSLVQPKDKRGNGLEEISQIRETFRSI